MKILSVLKYPDERLYTVAEPVEDFGDWLGDISRDMLKTMYSYNGVGLAATQVDIHIRLIVMDMSSNRSNPRVFVNPTITSRSGTQFNEEGCLSFPGVFKRLMRDEIVRVHAYDIDGEEFDLELSGMSSVCLQHEMDHLEGKLFTK